MKKKVQDLFAKGEGYFGNLASKMKKESNDDLVKPDLDMDFYNECLEKFSSRRSVRKFSSKPVEWSVIYEIIKAAMSAPCAGGVDNYKFITIKDKKAHNEIAKIQAEQYWMDEAPVMLAIVRDNSRLEELYDKSGEKFAIQNCAALIQNILMLCHLRGLGACWVEACDDGSIESYLGVPSGSYVDAIIPIGYSLDSFEPSNKHPIEEKLFFENAGNRSLK